MGLTLDRERICEGVVVEIVVYVDPKSQSSCPPKWYFEYFEFEVIGIEDVRGRFRSYDPYTS